MTASPQESPSANEQSTALGEKAFTSVSAPAEATEGSQLRAMAEPPRSHMLSDVSGRHPELFEPVRCGASCGVHYEHGGS